MKLPKQLHVEISTFCNLKCEYCVLKENLPKQELMPINKFIKLTPYLKYLHAISLSGLAEPLINKDIIKIIKHIKSVNKGCWISIFTNGMLLTKELSEKLIESGLDQLIFSIDSNEESINNSTRIGSNLSQIYNNINTLNKIKNQKYSKTPYLHTTTVLQRKNYKNLPALIKFLAPLKISEISINSLEPYSENLVPEILWQNQPEDLAEVINKAKKIAKENKITISFTSQTPQPPCCNPNTPFILPNGDTTICAALVYQRNFYYCVNKQLQITPKTGKTNPKYFGNIFETSLEKVWKNAEYSKFRKNISENQFPQECQHCLVKHHLICP
jgi:MoaA/NifB/PqqE/SkfB family radical SAM enzyme